MATFDITTADAAYLKVLRPLRWTACVGAPVLVLLGTAWLIATLHQILWLGFGVFLIGAGGCLAYAGAFVGKRAPAKQVTVRPTGVTFSGVSEEIASLEWSALPPKTAIADLRSRSDADAALGCYIVAGKWDFGVTPEAMEAILKAAAAAGCHVNQKPNPTSKRERDRAGSQRIYAIS